MSDPVWNCEGCGKVNPARPTITKCVACGQTRPGSPAAKPASPGPARPPRAATEIPPGPEFPAERESASAATPTPPIVAPPTPVFARYKEAYRMAKATITFGNIIKVLALIIGILLIVAGFNASVQYGPNAFFASLLLVAFIAIPIFIAGFLVSAQGEILRAVLDTAVNTSPLVTRDDLQSFMRE
jgi:hypothetical protein